MRQWLSWFAAVWFGLALAAAAHAGPNAASRFGLKWARGYDKWAYTHHVAGRITQIGCKPDGLVAVACKAVMRDVNSGARLCVGLVLGTESVPGLHTPLLGHVTLPDRSCGIAPSSPLAA